MYLCRLDWGKGNNSVVDVFLLKIVVAKFVIIAFDIVLLNDLSVFVNSFVEFWKLGLGFATVKIILCVVGT